MTDNVTTLPTVTADTDVFDGINSTVIPDRHVVVVTGSPDAYDDKAWHVVFNILDRAHAKRPITLIVTTGNRGIETIADAWADRNNVRALYATYNLTREDWDRIGRGAGPSRNRRLLREQTPDAVIGFVNKPLEQSTETKSMLTIAGEQSYATHLFNTTTGVKEF